MRFLKTCFVLMLSAGIVFTCIPSSYADDTSDVILKLLIKKGIISQQEVDGINAEIAKEKPKVPESIEERVTALEEKTKKPLIAVGEGDLEIGGYVQARYTNNDLDSSSDGFNIPNAKISLKGHVVPEVFYKLEIGPHQSTSILYDAYVTLSYVPSTDITVGQFKIPFLQEYITSSSAIDTINRSYFANSARLANEYGTGAMISSKNLFDGALEYYAAIESGRDRNGAEDTDQESFTGRLVLNPFKNSRPEGSDILKGLQIGASTQIGKQDSGPTYEGRRDRYAGYLKYDLKDVLTDKDYFKIQSEYVSQTRDRTGSTADLDSYGWYVLANYKFPASLFNHDMFLEPVVKFERYEPNKSAAGDREDWYTAGINLHINKYVKWMTNYIWKDEQAASRISNDQVITQLQYKF